jgi:RNA polymerase sigma factor (sigma-70 family)
MMHQRSGLAENAQMMNFSQVTRQILTGDRDAVGQLYGHVMPGLRAFLAMRVPRDLIGDMSHDIFLALVRCIEKGAIRDPRCLYGIIRTIAVRLVAEYRKSKCTSASSVDATLLEASVPDNRQNQEVEIQKKQRLEIAFEVLASLSARDKEILRRFYLLEQSQEQICQEMGLTSTQFRLLKSRAKARFSELARRRMQRKIPRVG